MNFENPREEKQLRKLFKELNDLDVIERSLEEGGNMSRFLALFDKMCQAISALKVENYQNNIAAEVQHLVGKLKEITGLRSEIFSNKALNMASFLDGNFDASLSLSLSRSLSLQVNFKCSQALARKALYFISLSYLTGILTGKIELNKTEETIVIRFEELIEGAGRLKLKFSGMIANNALKKGRVEAAKRRVDAAESRFEVHSIKQCKLHQCAHCAKRPADLFTQAPIRTPIRAGGLMDGILVFQ